MAVPAEPQGPLDPVDAEARTLAGMLAQRARRSPDALAFHDGAAALTYAELAADAAGLAAGLAHLGVRRGDRVALLLAAGLDFIRAFYALQHLGATPCAFDPRSPPLTAARRAARARPSLVLLGEETGAAVGDADGVDDAHGVEAACAAAGLRTARLGSVPRGFVAGASSPDDAAAAGTADDDRRPAYMQPTSGTSGEPRLAVLSHRSVLAWQRSSTSALADYEISRRLVSWVPPWHDLGLVRFVIGPVFLGSPCHLVEPAIRTLGTWLRTVAAVGASLIGAPDFAYRLATRLVDPAGLDLSTLRYAIDGGEPIRASTVAAFEERFGVPGVIRPGYGLAEATLGVTFLRPGEPLRVDSRGNVSCGPASPGFEVRIDTSPGDAGKPGEADEVGEILVRGDAVFDGYFDDEEASREALRGGWLRTGDIGKLDADSHLYVLARRRALLKRGGSPLAPREIEEAAEQVAGVRLSAAVARPAAAAGGASEAIVVVVEAELDRGTAAAAGARSALAAAVSAAVTRAVGFAPDRVLVVAPRTIPRTANGKVRHHRLQRALLEGGEGFEG